MTLLSIAMLGIITALVMAWEGDFSGILMIGKVIAYLVVILAFLWFLAVTGWGGVFLILGISILIGICSSLKE